MTIRGRLGPINSMNPKVNWFFDKDTRWRESYEKLRIMVLDCGLTEELKRGRPCYTINKKNVVMIHGFKDYCALLFHKGAPLKDKDGILAHQTENVQSAQQIRFKGLHEHWCSGNSLKPLTTEAAHSILACFISQPYT